MPNLGSELMDKLKALGESVAQASKLEASSASTKPSIAIPPKTSKRFAMPPKCEHCANPAIGVLVVNDNETAVCDEHRKSLEMMMKASGIAVEFVSYEDVKRALKENEERIEKERKEKEEKEAKERQKKAEEERKKKETEEKRIREQVADDDALDLLGQLILKNMQDVEPVTNFEEGKSVYADVYDNLRTEPIPKITDFNYKVSFKAALDKLLKDTWITEIDLKGAHKAESKSIRAYQSAIGVPTNVFKYYAKEAFMNWLALDDKGRDEALKILKPVITTTKKPTPKAAGIKLPDAEFLIETCEKYPSLEGIYAKKEVCAEFFRANGVYIQDLLLRKILLAIERDRAVILFGEPGDGKSLTIETLLRWITMTEYFSYTDSKGKKKEVPGFNAHLNPATKSFPVKDKKQPGFNFEYLGVDPYTTPLTLFGGYAPESIGGDPSNRSIEWGKISQCIFGGKYLYLDEVNRGDPENLARINGFLEAPYEYSVPEAKYKFWLKKPHEGIPRGNFLIMGALNLGDKGSNTMGNALRRRFKFIGVSYTGAEMVAVLSNVYSSHDYKSSIYSKKELENFQSLAEKYAQIPSSSTSKQFVEDKWVVPMNRFVSELVKNVRKNSEEWVSKNYTTFGAGISHFMEILKNISVGIQDIIVDVGGKPAQTTISEASFKNAINRMFSDLFEEDLARTLVGDDNDLYRVQQVIDSSNALRNELSSLLSQTLILIGQSLKLDEQNKLLVSSDVTKRSFYAELIEYLFKFDSKIASSVRTSPY